MIPVQIALCMFSREGDFIEKHINVRSVKLRLVIFLFKFAVILSTEGRLLLCFHKAQKICQRFLNTNKTIPQLLSN